MQFDSISFELPQNQLMPTETFSIFPPPLRLLPFQKAASVAVRGSIDSPLVSPIISSSKIFRISYSLTSLEAYDVLEPEKIVTNNIPCKQQGMEESRRRRQPLAINSIVVNVADAARASNIIPQQGCSYVIFSSRRSLNFDKLPIDVTRSIQECLLVAIRHPGWQQNDERGCIIMTEKTSC